MQIWVKGKNFWLNYHHLYYFLVIATEGGVARASEKLKLGQPTLSSQLRQLEESLGISLFERSHKKLILTETGKVILEYAKEIFRIGGEMVEVIQDQLPERKTHVQIGALDSVPKHVVKELVKQALKIGNCAISILEGKPEELVRELMNHQIDLLLTSYVPPLAKDSGLFAKSICRSPIVLCGASKFKSLRKGFPSSIDGMPFVMPTEHSKLRQDVEHYMRLNGIKANLVAETQDTSLQKILGVEGLGLVPAPLTAVENFLKKKELFEIGRLKGVQEELFLISASRKIENPISSQLMKTFNIS
jgi:LysR family transcriptional regulator, transcriptional activator of nhaA